MPYATTEGSQFEGVPVECYLFTYGTAADETPTTLAAYCDADLAVTIDTVEYAPTYITRSNIVNTQDAHKMTLSVSVPKDSAVVEQFKVWMDDKVFLTIRKTHYGDTQDVYLFKGRVTSCAIKGNEAELQCESSFSIMARNGLQRRYSIGCPHTLYDPLTCQVAEITMRGSGTVESIDPATQIITLSGMANLDTDYCTGGTIQLSTIPPHQYRTVIEHVNVSDTSGTFKVSSIPAGLLVGAIVYYLPGCDKNHAHCVNRFSNGDNFGGFPIMPQTNPFVIPPNMPPSRT